MEIIDYSLEYEERMKDLLVELQEHIAKIDREGYNILTEDFREKYFAKTMEEVKAYQGKILLALIDHQVVGLAVGLIHNEEEETYDFVAPRRGVVTELIASKNARSQGVGKALLGAMEQHFREVGCKGFLLSVFAYNEDAYQFYLKNGYFHRMIEMMKKL